MAYDVYVHKQGVEGVSALNPESPANEVATNAARIAIKKTTLLGYGKLLANRTINTIASEMKADGNERAATELANTSRAANVLVAAVATKGLSLIPETISAVATQIVRQRAAERDTKRAELETRLKGGRSNFNQGSVHFD
jgi:regulator of protease activity HflC (stomatin/prohibitin superfamily)